MINVILIVLQLTFSGYSQPYPITEPQWLPNIHEFEPLDL